MALVVRAAGPVDDEAARRVAALAFETVRAVYRPSPAAVATASEIELERLVAIADGDVVGTVRFGVADERLRVIGLAVLPACRRRGIARALLDELARIAQARGGRVLALFTIVQTGNVAVFERLGFRCIWEAAAADSISVTGRPLTEAYMERDVPAG
jgi:ribosomal protein S18 acetylase RimI-like enzyme